MYNSAITRHGLAELKTISIEPRKTDSLVISLQREDLGDKFYRLPDPCLGLTRKEASVLELAADELLRNVNHAYDPENRTGRWKYDSTGFSRTAELGLPAAELTIEFDSEIGAGMIAVSHLVFPDITPPLDLEEARRIRPVKINPEKSGRGGIFGIERGSIHHMLKKNANLEHSPIETEDSVGESGHQRRTVSFRFQRKVT